jgi:undecaprenyl-diphosphatase
MTDEHRTQKPDEETRKAAEPVQEQLEAALEQADTPEKAKSVVERLVEDTSEPTVEEVAEETARRRQGGTQEQVEQAAQEARSAAGDGEPSSPDQAAEVIEQVAAEAAGLEGDAYEAVAGSVQDATNPELRGEPEKLEAPRRWLRETLVRHPAVGFLDRVDTELFIFLNNHTPRSRTVDRFLGGLSFWFSGGWGWILGVGALLPFQTRWAVKGLKLITLPIWVTGLIVEYPVKKYFRRRRPFIDIVRAIVVGKKPGNWSFPSGHSATAFAGARMMARLLPRWRSLWYTVAGLVGLSRIYVGAHYPGDVVSGSVIGLILSEVTHWVVERLKRK